MNLANVGKVGISFTVVVGFFYILVLVITNKTQGGPTPEVMLVMLGALGQAFAQVISYWVGSSQSSSSKDEALKEIAATKPPAGTS